MKQELTAEQVAEALYRLYEAILSETPESGRVGVIGIRTRGETLARRIVEKLVSDRPDIDLAYGVLDITFYRDDLSRRKGAPLVRATDINFELDDAWVLLVDDVQQTGRSVRAALDAIHDFGRPRIVRLAVLIDRGGRELPIVPDFVGRRLDAPAGTRVQVKFKENDGEEGVYLIGQEE